MKILGTAFALLLLTVSGPSHAQELENRAELRVSANTSLLKLDESTRIYHVDRRIGIDTVEPLAKIHGGGLPQDTSGRGNEDSVVLRVDDQNHWLWTPYQRPDNEFGIFWATDEKAAYKTKDRQKNPNELVFVGYGKPRAAISLTSGSAYFSELTIDVDHWADFVFDADHRLMSLEEVESYIDRHGRLPGVQSADEVRDRGLSVGEAQVQLLQKIEELTLYAIEQNKRVRTLENRLQDLCPSAPEDD